MCNWHDGNKSNLKTIEAQIVQKLKTNEALQKFTGSYKKKRVWQHYILDKKQIVNFSSNQLPHKNLFCFMIEICSHSSKFLRISVNGVQKYRSK